ncbi:helix-turn-helix domain-containing protein [Xylophilus sp. ASV27]|uniref:helix-turn-helix domain-containing protein n=1 Tax=Xylophilus sp. ASV27 TaxID=2795129 RepID=UPI0018ED8503|nr:hypothetical protein [Xylophilus sp. ASV27]
MPEKTPHPEAEVFAKRLRQALTSAGIPLSPTTVAHEFNLRYWGKGVSLYAVRNWLLGISIPTQDKLRVLAQWLGVPPQELRFGPEGGVAAAREPDPLVRRLIPLDQAMLRRYLRLSPQHRTLIRDMVDALPTRTPD